MSPNFSQRKSVTLQAFMYICACLMTWIFAREDRRASHQVQDRDNSKRWWVLIGQLFVDTDFWLVNTYFWLVNHCKYSLLICYFRCRNRGLEEQRFYEMIKLRNSLRSCWTRLDCLTRRMKTVRLWLSPSAVCCIPSQGIVESNVSSPATKESKHPDHPMTLPSQPSCCVIRNSWERHTLLQ